MDTSRLHSDLITLSLLVICWIAYLLHRLHETNLQKQLFGHIAWCRKMHLLSYIRSFQRQLSIPEKYRIVGDYEEQYAKEILSAFLANLVNQYFEGKLLPVRSKYVVPGEHYFAHMLWSYCYSHSCKSEVAGHSMHSKTISSEHYESSVEWDATYSLSDFAVVFYKLYYIAFRFLGESLIFNKKGTLYQDASLIENELDTRCISVSYRQQF